jgi:3,4-dihydroxy-2-butanone 4-phosphate synthase
MLSSIPEILEDLRHGRPVILVGDEESRGQGDLVCAAEDGSPACRKSCRESVAILRKPLIRDL